MLLEKTPPQWRPFVMFIAQTGTRIGEAIVIQWGDIDFGRRVVSIERRLYRGMMDTPKSKYGKRRIPLSSAMTQTLWELRRTAADAGDDALVWSTSAGTPYNPANLTTRVLKPAAKAAGLWPMVWHVLRHSCASELFRRGLNPKAIQAWLGHHSVAFTVDTYVHLMESDLPASPFEVGNTWATRPAEIGRDAETAEGAETTV